MQRGIPVLLSSLAGFFSRPVISSFQAAKFGPGCRNLSFKNRREAKRLIPLLAGLCLYALSAQAQKTWIDGTGNWTTPINWTPFGAPSASQIAIINNTGTAHVTSSDTAASLSLGQFPFPFGGTVSITGPAGVLTISAGGSSIIGNLGPGTVDVSAGGQYKFGNGSLTLGFNATGSGTVTIDGTGSILQGTGPVIIGRLGTGTAP